MRHVNLVGLDWKVGEFLLSIWIALHRTGFRNLLKSPLNKLEVYDYKQITSQRRN